MAYNKTNWENAPSTNTPINASNLNKMEEGIYENSLTSEGNSNKIGTLSNLDTTDKSNLVAAINEEKGIIDKIGKVLWTGSFETGSITVPHLNEYTIIGIYYSSSVLMIGNQYYGGLSFTKFNSLSTTAYGYRYTYNSTNNTLTVDASNTGATDGTNRVAVNKIIGII